MEIGTDELFSLELYRLETGMVPKPPLRDGNPGGLRFVWDGRSVNRVIKADSFLIPRVEDLIERIARLKHESNAKGCSEMWILDEDSRPTCGRVFQWVF